MSSTTKGEMRLLWRAQIRIPVQTTASMLMTICVVIIWTPLGETPSKSSVVALGDSSATSRSSLPRGNNNNMGGIVQER